MRGGGVSGPETHDPLVVNTQDGCCWERRAVTRGGRGLYVVAGTPRCCPEYVMATLPELAEHGLAGMAFALPVPAGDAPQRDAEDEPVDVFVPRTERSYWVDIAAALNAAHSVGMPVGIDLDGTLTDRTAWSVVWDREAEQWMVAGYDEEANELRSCCAGPECTCTASSPQDDLYVAPAVEDVAPQVQKLRALLAGQREGNGEFHDALHHSYRVSHDLPETGGGQ
ncbi:hypothetical protein ALMP_60390 [Streptomyces sp. A012304]|nr:hypothetical protein ALMP_60390 [Streptomyces sp. A012304]